MAAFQNAQLYLGDDFAAATARNPNYRELSPQIAINRLLYAQQIDVGISDINIFQNMNKQLANDFDVANPLCSYALFPPTLYRLAFRVREVRDRFNVALSHLLTGDAYETLAERYSLPLDHGHPYFKPAVAAH